MATHDATTTAEHGGGHAPGERPHPGPREYVKVAIWLAIVTAIEVGLYYIQDIPDALLIVALVALSIIKFALVVLWFMHLRFDSRILRRLFVTGILLAASIYAIVLIITMFNRRTGAEGLSG